MDSIDNRLLDRLVAEHVMGLTANESESFRPSENIDDARKVIAEVKKRTGFSVAWEDDLCKNYHPILLGSNRLKTIFAPQGCFDYQRDLWVKSKEQAICLAGLIAMDIQNKSVCMAEAMLEVFGPLGQHKYTTLPVRS